MGAAEVEGLDFVAVCATSAGLVTGSANSRQAGNMDVHRKHRGVFINTQCAKGVSRCVGG